MLRGADSGQPSGYPGYRRGRCTRLALRRAVGTIGRIARFRASDSFLHLHKFRDGDGPTEANGQVHMIRDAPGTAALASGIPCDRREVGMQPRTDGGVHDPRPVLGGEYHVNEEERQSLRHGRDEWFTVCREPCPVPRLPYRCDAGTLRPGMRELAPRIEGAGAPRA